MHYRHHWLLRLRPAFIASFLKRILRVKRRLIETSEGKFFIDPLSNFGDRLLTAGGYEPEMTDSLKRILKNGDTFLDIGANEGYFSILASRYVGKTGKVICIEPQSRLQCIIIKNIEENKSENIEVFQRAISDSNGTAVLYLSPDMNTGSSGLFRTTKYRTLVENVPLTTLSQFLGDLNIKKINLMKIDVEGFEYEIILGSKSVFEEGIVDNIALELHPTTLAKRGKSDLDIMDFLKGCGYKKNNKYEALIMSRNNE